MKILNGKYNLRQYKAGDEDGILKLWKTAFKSDMALDIFQWKYLDNPYNKCMMLCVAENSEIVTFYGGIPFKFQYENKAAFVVQLMDIMSHPDHRGNRLFERTAKQFISSFCTPDNLLLMYGFPGGIHYSIGERILNYKKINDVSYFKMHIGKEKIKNSSNSQSVVLEEIKEMDGAGSGFDLLWEKCKQYYLFSIIRDADFVKWRYFDHPQKNYNVLSFKNSMDDSVLGYAVLLMNGDKVSLVDLLVLDSQNYFNDIINGIKGYLLAFDIREMEVWLPDKHFLSGHVLSAGFIKENEPLGIIPTVALYEHSPAHEWVISNIYYNMGDGDLF